MLKDTPTCDFGWPLPSFELSDARGTSHRSDNHLTSKGLLVAFICNHCPYVKAIAARMASDFTELRAQGIGVLAVMSNDFHSYPADAPDRMLDFAEHYGLDVPYLVDADQQVGRAFDAVCTPDFFGFSGAGALQYRGRLDSAGMGDPAGRTRELVDAMLQIATSGQGPQVQTPSIGCSIKWRNRDR
jgi:peroxiredoxin